MTKAIIEHVETRQQKNKSIDCGCPASDRKFTVDGQYFDIFITLRVNKKGLLQILRLLRQGSLAEFTILKEQLISIKGASTPFKLINSSIEFIDFTLFFQWHTQSIGLSHS